MIANFGCFPSGQNITYRKHWHFSNPESSCEIHLLYVEPSLTLWYVLVGFLTMHNKGKWALIVI